MLTPGGGKCGHVVEGEAALAGLEPAECRPVDGGQFGPLLPRQASDVAELTAALPDAGQQRARRRGRRASRPRRTSAARLLRRGRAELAPYPAVEVAGGEIVDGAPRGSVLILHKAMAAVETGGTLVAPRSNEAHRVLTAHQAPEPTPCCEHAEHGSGGSNRAKEGVSPHDGQRKRRLAR